jgi:very-short-patch-repair endonuclease/predicted transcriptional regulator of viral defense system
VVDLSVAQQPSDDTRLTELAFRQHGVVGWTQLLELGFTRQRIRSLAALQRLHRLFPGVYAVGHVRLTQRGRWMATVLACGPDALLSHRDAGRLEGLLRSTGSGPIHVTAPGVHALPGITCHRRRTPDPLDATVIDGIPVTTWARTVLDLATLLPGPRLRDALELAARQERDFSELRALLERSPGHHGLGRLRAALEELDDGIADPWSAGEVDLLALIREAGLPEPRVNVVVAGEVVDFHWPAQRLVVEVDGRTWHGLQRDMESDRRKDVRLTLAGQRPVRYTKRRIATESAAVIAEIRTLLGLGRA